MLIKDGDKIRECDKNIVTLGYWRSLRHFFGYKYCFKQIDFEDVFKAFYFSFQSVVIFLAFPVLPFIVTWLKLKEARRLIELEI